MMRLTRRLRLSIVICNALILSSCTHKPTEKFDTAIKGGRCEEALEHVGGMRDELRYTGRVNRAAGTALSYTATGASYGADVILTLVGGSIIFVALCGPMMVLTAASGGGGSNGNCIPADLQGVTLPHHGRDTFKSTEEMRCPDLTLLARAMRQVATCQESRGGPESLKTASTTLHSMTANREFMNCIVESERVGIETDVYRMDLAIAAP